MKNLLLSLVAFLALGLYADRLTMTDGSILNGTVKSIADGVALVSTDFAGEIRISADKIVAITTVDPVNVVLTDASGVDSEAISTNEVNSAVKYLWTAGMDDPTLPSTRKWDGEISLDIAGKTGNTEKFNGGAGAIANLTGSEDKLKLYGNASYGREEHNTNTEKYVVGIDYERRIASSSTTWYVNGEAEHQPTSGIRLREEVGFGLGQYLLDEPHSKFRIRAGLSGKCRKFMDGTHNDGFGAEASIHYEHDIQEWGKWVTDLTYQPSFDSINDYRILHESSLDIPVLFQFPTSLRLGISNEYNSRTAAGADRLETCYFAKMVFKWK